MDTIAITGKIYKRLQSYISGKPLGMSTGFKDLDRMTGRIEEGNLVVIGGFPGVGKSYMVFNMIDRMREEKADLKVAVFSTELSEDDYILRYICMRLGIWKNQLQDHVITYAEEIKKQLKSLLDKNNPFKLEIFGSITTLEQVEEQLLKDKYDIVFIDFTQQLTARGHYDTKDCMPIVAKELKRIALERRIGIIAMSQVNLYAMKSEFKQDETISPPFSYGKELNESASMAISLSRKKTEGSFEDKLIFDVVKAREGMIGRTLMQINPGYRLNEIPYEERVSYFNSLKQ